MIFTNKDIRGELYKGCSSIEIKTPRPNTIQVISLDSFVMNEVSFTKEEELREAVIAAILYIYLKDEVILTNELCQLFESTELQLKSAEINYDGYMIMYSDIIVNGLIKAGYKEGLRENALNFFEKK